MVSPIETLLNRWTALLVAGNAAEFVESATTGLRAGEKMIYPAPLIAVIVAELQSCRLGLRAGLSTKREAEQ